MVCVRSAPCSVLLQIGPGTVLTATVGCKYRCDPFKAKSYNSRCRFLHRGKVSQGTGNAIRRFGCRWNPDMLGSQSERSFRAAPSWLAAASLRRLPLPAGCSGLMDFGLSGSPFLFGWQVIRSFRLKAKALGRKRKLIDSRITHAVGVLPRGAVAWNSKGIQTRNNPTQGTSSGLRRSEARIQRSAGVRHSRSDSFVRWRPVPVFGQIRDRQIDCGVVY